MWRIYFSSMAWRGVTASTIRRLMLNGQKSATAKSKSLRRTKRASYWQPQGADFLPCLAVGMFAGLRSAEIERLEWKDIDLKQRHIVVSADNAKTADRRIVPIAANLAEWLEKPSKMAVASLGNKSSILYYKRQEA